MRHFLHGLRRLWLAGTLGLTSALGLTLLLTGMASAHASYVSSNPAAGAVVATAPTQVTVTFAENVNPAGKNGIPSSLQVFLKPELKNTFYSDQDATLVSTGQTQFPLSNAKSMSIAMKGAGNGIYEVYWHTVSADDGDPDSGVFFFGVGTGNVLGTGSTTSPAPTTSATSSGVAVWVPILVGILALLVGGGAGAWLTRRSSPAGSGGQAPASRAPDRDPAGRR
ncbi:MAG TPA: copper resistance CopC family protein [Ktedonobacterales bacterium]|nr:copper resistance CopC family protein [Ktedonobacterales bacterium]